MMSKEIRYTLLFGGGIAILLLLLMMKEDTTTTFIIDTEKPINKKTEKNFYANTTIQYLTSKEKNGTHNVEELLYNSKVVENRKSENLLHKTIQIVIIDGLDRKHIQVSPSEIRASDSYVSLIIDHNKIRLPKKYLQGNKKIKVILDPKTKNIQSIAIENSVQFTPLPSPKGDLPMFNFQSVSHKKNM